MIPRSALLYGKREPLPRRVSNYSAVNFFIDEIAPSADDLRNHYAEISEMLKDHDHVIITNHGRGESVLINIEDYAKYEEFLHQRYVAEALAKAKQQAADPDTQWADHESVWETLGKQYDV